MVRPSPVVYDGCIDVSTPKILEQRRAIKKS